MVMKYTVFVLPHWEFAFQSNIPLVSTFKSRKFTTSVNNAANFWSRNNTFWLFLKRLEQFFRMFFFPGDRCIKQKSTFVMFEGVGLIGPCLTPLTVCSIWWHALCSLAQQTCMTRTGTTDPTLSSLAFPRIFFSHLFLNFALSRSMLIFQSFFVSN